jgi:hypothetical protein
LAGASRQETAVHDTTHTEHDTPETGAPTELRVMPA